MPTSQNSLGKKISNLRKKNGISQQTLANAIGVSNQLISMYERGVRKPKIEKVEELANYFNVSISYLMGTDKLVQSLFKSVNGAIEATDRRQLTRYSKILQTVLESFDDSNRKHLEKLQDEIKEANDLKEFEFLMSELMTIFLYAKSGNSKEADECYTKVQEIIEDFAGSLPEFQTPSPDIRPPK